MFRKILIRITMLILFAYIGICGYMYFAQESLIFHPEKMNKNEQISFGIEMEDLQVKSYDGTKLSAVHCESIDTTSGKLVFFLHGNAGNLHDQKQAAQFYTDLGYNFFTFDYRGFGKSEGEITDENQFFKDIESMYKEMRSIYSEDSIIVIGYSVGTGSAAMISSRMKPSKLVLIAPYISLIDMTERRYPFLPTALLKYKFETNQFLKEISIPVLIVHGDKDDVLPVDGARELKKLLKSNGKYVELKGQNHDDFEHNELFIKSLSDFGIN